MNNLMG
jgi:hypothetical protein